MFPDLSSIIIVILLTLLIIIITQQLPKRTGIFVEIILVLATLAYLFINFSFVDAMMLMSLSATAYANFGMLLNDNKKKLKRELERQLSLTHFQTITQVKDFRRIAVDLLLSLIISIGSIVFFLFAPETYMLLKFFIGMGLITVLTQTVGRIGAFISTTLYWLPREERLIILSTFESRDFPLCDLKEVKLESAPDLLRLHPLFRMLSESQDYTGSFHAVIRLSFPGENIYISPNEEEKWKQNFQAYTCDTEEEIKKVLPLWHRKTLQRLFWKGYFAVTVKGVSAYTGLLFILIWLDVPWYVTIVFILCWWMFNLYVSDRVLIAGTDAERVIKGDLFTRAKVIFSKAGIPQTRLYLIDSPVHNGLATGMNIGRGTIMITKATTELSTDAVDAILAHEAIHIKKRDVLTNQISRMLFFGLVALIVYLFFGQITLLADHPLILIPLIYILMMLFPMYLTFISQWTEVRADHLGANLLPNGNEQMANGLFELGSAQDQELDKVLTYSSKDAKPLKKVSNTERDKWFFRVLEFQFQAHPPLYFRIKCLSEQLSWRKASKVWMVGRVKESIPDYFRQRKNA